jgi:antitoxin MazE
MGQSRKTGGVNMRTKVQRWGHSLALRIPKPFAIEAKLGDQTEVDLTVTNGKLVVAPATKPAHSLEDLLSRVTKRNLHGEIDTGTPVGREAW